MPINRKSLSVYKPFGCKLSSEVTTGDWKNTPNENVKFVNIYEPSSTKHDTSNRLDNSDAFWTKSRTTASRVPFEMSSEDGSASFSSSSSSDLMSSSLIEGKCCEEHLSLTREMAIQLLKEYVKNLKDFSSMMREKQLTTVRDISTSPIQSPVLDTLERQNCVRKRETQCSDHTSNRQRPSSMLGISNAHQSGYGLVDTSRSQTPTNFSSSCDYVIDIPVTSSRKQLFPTSSIGKITGQPSNYSEKPYSAMIDNRPWFSTNNFDSDESGKQTPVNYEPNLPKTMMKSEKYYQLQKDPENSMPILSATKTDSNTTSDCKKEKYKDLDKVVMLPPQPDILRSERPQKPNVVIVDEKTNGEVIVAEKKSKTPLSPPNHFLHMHTPDVGKIERLRINSPSPSYVTSVASFENSFRLIPPKPEYHSSPTSQPKIYHQGTQRSSSLQRVVPNSTKETPRIKNVYNTQSQNTHRSLVKSSSSIPLGGTPSYTESISPKSTTPFSQASSVSNYVDYLEYDTSQTLGNTFSKHDFSSDKLGFTHKSHHVTEINKQSYWTDNSKFPTNFNSYVGQNGFQSHTNQPSIKTYAESGVQSVQPSSVCTFENVTNKAVSIQTTDDIPTLKRGNKTRISVEDSLLSPNKYRFRVDSEQNPPTLFQQSNSSKKLHIGSSQYESGMFYQRKSDKTTQTDDFNDDSWTTGSLDFSNNQDFEAPCDLETASPANEPNLQTWTLSLQSIVRPTESECILHNTNKINCMEHANMHIEETKLSENKMQSSSDYHKEPWRRHSLRIIPSDSDSYPATQKNVDHSSDWPNRKFSLPRKPRTTSRFSIGSTSDLDTPKCRSVHFSNDVLVAHTGSGPEPLLLSSAPLKESMSEDEAEQNSYFTEIKPNYLSKLSVDCGHNTSNFSKPPKSRINTSRPSAPLPFRRQFVFNTPSNFDF
ncbi:hypothetical protein EWB00_003918 [Schistosoma japonicum]|uniref:Uncharacterized protein n=1 Tax=Schistosoma japonicum TaxID=6182 RepID=A0A4Z2DV91_SCHJA|nr:hypothetical protein EWB00_003918 [Schistosoma japonicum]